MLLFFFEVQHFANVMAFGLAMSGISLVLYPPTRSPGIWIDRAVVALLVCFLFAFIPQFYWSDPAWRVDAVESFGIDLPSLLSIQPMISLETWVSAVAAFAWLYAANSWPINHSGRRWVFLISSLVSGVFAVFVIWEYVIFDSDTSGEVLQVSGYFTNPSRSVAFLAISGVVAFTYAMSNLRARLFAPFVGILVSAACLFAMIWAIDHVALFVFLAGIFTWFFLQFRSVGVSRVLRICFLLVLLAFTFFISAHSGTKERVVDFITMSGGWAKEPHIPVYADAIDMILDAPLTGIGLGNFDAVFPQYREHSLNHLKFVHPDSDLLRLTAEAGLLGLLLFVGFVVAFGWHCRGFTVGRSGVYRLIAMVAVVAFLAQTLVDTPARSPGTLYLTIVFAALALPRKNQKRTSFNPVIWRSIGGLLIGFAGFWALTGTSDLPLYSSTAAKQRSAEENLASADYEKWLHAQDQWIARKPLDWRAYSERGKILLIDPAMQEEADEAFRQARFVEPTLGIVPYEEGFAWLPHDQVRALNAWRESFNRELEDPETAFREIIDAVKEAELMDGLSKMSEMNADQRTIFLLSQKPTRFLIELQRELKEDPALAGFSRLQRDQILEKWITQADELRDAEAFIMNHGEGLRRPWWLLSLLRKEEIRFEEAVDLIREVIDAPMIPPSKIKQVRMERLTREFTLTPSDIMKGTALLQIYLNSGDYSSVFEVADIMMRASEEVPPYVTYWKAESLYRLNEYIESWHAFETYLKQTW
ncbi:MAG: O-antigen ligase family protein [Verrucomicrobiota bacterium]